MKRFQTPKQGLIFAITILGVLFVITPAFGAEIKELSMGWEPWEPYQYEDNSKQLTGLDIELVSAILKHMRFSIRFTKMPWKRHLKMLEQGKVDIAAGASKTPERENYAFFSKPYRKESAVLYVRRGEASKYKFKKLEEIIGNPFRLGATRGYYYGERYTELIQVPKFREHVQEVSSDRLNYLKLMKDRIDGFLSDPVTATAGLLREGLLEKVEILMPVYSDDIFVMFSKRSTSPEIVKGFNESLEDLKKNGTYDQILNKYLR